MALESVFSKPLVSIIIPLYNSEKYISATIESVISQQYTNWELIIVDDGSQDNSLSIATKYASDKIEVISQKNKGASAARNLGLKNSKGSFIQFLDADDLISSDKISAQLAVANSSTNYLILSSTIHFYDHNHLENLEQIHEWYSNGNDNPFDFLVKLYSYDEFDYKYGGMIQPNAWLTPKKLIDDAGPWNEELSVDDDGEFFCRVVLASKGIKYSKVGINYYRKHINESNLSSQKSYKAHLSQITSLNLKLKHLLNKADDDLAKKIMSRHFWEAGVSIYPRFKKLSKYCISKAKKLGYSGKKYRAGKLGEFASKIFGWKLVKFLSTKLYYLRKTVFNGKI